MKLQNVFFWAMLLAGAQLSASTIIYTANLNGANENPATASSATGFAMVTIDNVAQTMEVNVTFQGLTSGNTASHIHCCIAAPGNVGVATTTPTFTGFPGGVTSGSYDNVFDMTLASSYNPSFVTANGSVSNAEAVLFAGIAAGNAYLNIHTTNFQNGEIRGYLSPAVPEPATLGLVGLTLAGLFGFRRRINL